MDEREAEKGEFNFSLARFRVNFHSISRYLLPSFILIAIHEEEEEKEEEILAIDTPLCRRETILITQYIRLSKYVCRGNGNNDTCTGCPQIERSNCTSTC